MLLLPHSFLTHSMCVCALGRGGEGDNTYVKAACSGEQQENRTANCLQTLLELLVKQQGDKKLKISACSHLQCCSVLPDPPGCNPE